MADVFMTYAAADKARVAPIAEALAARGLSVVWDHDMAHLASAKVVTPIWSQASIAPDFDLTAANAGKARGALAAAFIDPVSAPPGFAQFPGENLADFPAGSAEAFNGFVRAIQQAMPADPRVQRAMPMRASAAKPPGVARFLLPAALGVAVLGVGAFFLLQQNSAPVQTEPLPDRLGVAERYGLSDADVMALAPDALVRKALAQSSVAQLDAAAADDGLSLGLLCAAQYYGEGTPRDEAAAAVTCARGAERNAPGAGYILSLLQRPGDPAAADATLRAAADAGDARAQHEVAQMQRARQPRAARSTAELCAAQGHLGCRFLIAQMQAGGEGGPRDPAGATASYEAMAGENFAPAFRELGKMARARGDAKEATLQFKRAAILDDGEASYLLGEMAERGEGMAPDAATAQAHYRDASDDGYAADAPR